ncbi:uncharacterized protein BDV14DRAFT_175416 [Aspergillus stella-maris]|uniref:uncharacterized protein n=1 Tax=Aspergillus stella-maris TaxID=1810926 RepID=UPI003CCD139E
MLMLHKADLGWGRNNVLLLTLTPTPTLFLLISHSDLDPPHSAGCERGPLEILSGHGFSGRILTTSSLVCRWRYRCRYR